ncbi:MAG: tRNA (N(6)-L-threonylcarbamoyladenosine(37)-C(2))-methylthiotransferase MtaB [Lachnospiraceae bacterium]|nr:tRNA (N(6)-L-threonylcarbamoyladenosine(37)-C(2))-methylthiotransferase MtaB [Lachnospiraceae bacterium]
MKKVAFHNLGCKVNSYELDGISQMFQKRGYEIVDFAQKADIYIVNTCTVTNIADRKSRQMLSRAKALNPDAVVVAAGCYVQSDPEAAAKNTSVDIAVGNNHKSEIVDIVEEYLKNRDKAHTGSTVSDLAAPCDYEETPIAATSGHTRAFLKIQDGCNQFCSYCAIPYVRGRVRSRRASDIMDEAQRLAQNGYKEVVITGIHLSSYGLEGPYNEFAAAGLTNTALLDVIEAVSGVQGIERIRLGSLEARLMTEGFTQRLARIDKVCPHFHLSLQSGSDTVLKRMNRHYTVSEYEEKVDMIRSFYEHPAITTDTITGFPGESEEEFLQTRQFLQKIAPYECHIFKYSRRRGTAADKMDGQLTDAVKTERSKILIRDSDERKREFMSYYIGREVLILTEDTENEDGQIRTVGYTPEYVKVSIPGSESGLIRRILCFEPGCDKINGIMISEER